MATIWLADFGSAKAHVCYPDNLWTNIIYTLPYRPPEVLYSTEGNANYDFPADIWALGLSIYEVNSGYPLFNGKNVGDQKKQIADFFKNPDSKNKILDNAPFIGNIINEMIVFDQNYRATAYKLKNDDIFDSYRDNDGYDENQTQCSVSNATRDRYGKPYFLSDKYAWKRRMSIVNWLIDVYLSVRMRFKSIQTAISLLDQVTPLLIKDYSSNEEYEILGMACLSIAGNLVEIDPPEISDYVQTIGGGATIEKLNNMRIAIIEALDGDLLFTVPFDYGEEAVHYPEKCWKLAKTLMIYMNFDEIIFEIMPQDIFYFAMGISIFFYKEDGIKPRMRHILVKYGDRFINTIEKIQNSVFTAPSTYFNITMESESLTLNNFLSALYSMNERIN